MVAPAPLQIFKNNTFKYSLQGHPHHLRKAEASRASVHPSKLDLCALVWSKVLLPEACRHLSLYDHLAGTHVNILNIFFWHFICFFHTGEQVHNNPLQFVRISSLNSTADGVEHVLPQAHLRLPGVTPAQLVPDPPHRSHHSTNRTVRSAFEMTTF